jgi:ureidoacrylate peracid hydrolase
MNNIYTDPHHAALVLVDVQNDYCHDQGLKAQQGSDVSKFQNAVTVIDNLVQQARKAGVPIVFLKNLNSDEHTSEAQLHRPGGAARSAVTRKDTWGADIYRLVPEPGDVVIEKYRYSGFIHTELNEILQKLQRKSIVLTGFATNVCVESTARDGFMLDYHVALVKDGCAGYSAELEEATYQNMTKHFGAIFNSEEVLQHWNV